MLGDDGSGNSDCAARRLWLSCGGSLPLLLFFLDGFRLLLRRLCSSWRSKGWGEAYEAHEYEDRKQNIKERILPIDVHGPVEMRLLAAFSSGVASELSGCSSSARRRRRVQADGSSRGCLAHAERRTSCSSASTLVSDA